MNKRFCDVCGAEIEEERAIGDNDIFIRIEQDTDKFCISDCCEDCITEFRTMFSKFIKVKTARVKEDD